MGRDRGEGEEESLVIQRAHTMKYTRHKNRHEEYYLIDDIIIWEVDSVEQGREGVAISGGVEKKGVVGSGVLIQ